MKTDCHQAVVRFHDNGARRGRIMSSHRQGFIQGGRRIQLRLSTENLW